MCIDFIFLRRRLTPIYLEKQLNVFYRVSIVSKQGILEVLASLTTEVMCSFVLRRPRLVLHSVLLLKVLDLVGRQRFGHQISEGYLDG